MKSEATTNIMPTKIDFKNSQFYHVIMHFVRLRFPTNVFNFLTFIFRTKVVQRAMISILSNILFLTFVTDQTASFGWRICRTYIESNVDETNLDFCDLCYVPDLKQPKTIQQFLTPVINSAFLIPMGFDCSGQLDDKESYIVPQFTYLSKLLETQGLTECSAPNKQIEGTLVTLLNKQFNSVDICEEIKTLPGHLSMNLTWLFVNSQSSLFNKYQIKQILMKLTKLRGKVTSYIIDADYGAPKWLKVTSASSAFLTTVISLIVAIIVRNFDKNHFVYYLELFLNCNRQREKLTVGIFIGRITVLGSFIGGLFIIIFALLFTMVPIPFQYILDVCFLLSSSSSFMFLWARVVILIKHRNTHLTMRFQTILIVPSILIGLAVGVLVVLFKDEQYLREKSAMAYTKIGIFQTK